MVISGHLFLWLNLVYFGIPYLIMSLAWRFKKKYPIKLIWEEVESILRNSQLIEHPNTNNQAFGGSTHRRLPGSALEYFIKIKSNFWIIVVWGYGLIDDRTQDTDLILVPWGQSPHQTIPCDPRVHLLRGLPGTGKARMAVYRTFSFMTEFVIYFFFFIREMLYFG